MTSTSFLGSTRITLQFDLSRETLMPPHAIVAGGD